ncbi:MAG: hypothetical protein KJO85_01635, partial [Gammaproteobacteria bacterium]|nr:hypothetical protein [Gammaproteobacteria bacterium]
MFHTCIVPTALNITNAIRPVMLTARQSVGGCKFLDSTYTQSDINKSNDSTGSHYEIQYQVNPAGRPGLLRGPMG